MRKRGTRSARAPGKKSAGKRGGRKRDMRVSLIALCALGGGILAATYGLTHQRAPEANAQASGIAAPQAAGKEIAGTASTDPVSKEQAAGKEDRLITGSVPRQDEIAPPKVDPKAKPQAAKKKKPVPAVAKTQAPNSLFDVFNNGQQKR
jgi:hypothetical protein